MFCSHCGQELKEGGKFCPRCGAPVDPAAGAGFSTGYQKMNPGPQGAVMKKGVSPAVAAVIIGVILVCIAGLYLWHISCFSGILIRRRSKIW